MAAMYDGDNNRVFELDNTYKWEDCYGDEVLIGEPAYRRWKQPERAACLSGKRRFQCQRIHTDRVYQRYQSREYRSPCRVWSRRESTSGLYLWRKWNRERVSVDKSEESSYYLYDGRNSVTGILTETANLTNSYQYDSYGNLTSGTADGVNYYGYNGESTNVKTGLQYLRARYYNAENGTFTTEDSDHERQKIH